MDRFSSDISLGNLPPAQIAKYLLDIGDDLAAAEILQEGPAGQGYIFDRHVYLGSDALYGFIEPGSDEVTPASGIAADHSLKNKRLKITLDRFFVKNYPGGGQHRVLCEFAGKNQVPGEVEELRFATTCHARDGEGAAISALPIFLGVNAGQNGISFEGRTINVSNSTDDLVLDVLESETFKQGLSLIHSAQPAIKPFSKLAEGVVKLALSRNKNRQVHSFGLGLDFGTNSTSARLRCGSYIVIQIGSAANWDWSLFRWDRGTNSIVARTSSGVARTAWNYMVFGVSTFD